MTLLLVFLVVLVARYALLLWLSYLHHIESRGAGDRVHTAMPPVTIIVPVYNEATVVQAALRSLLELDYPAFEVLVVDDGSTDATFALASRLEGTYANVTVRVVTKANGGKASALNAGIALARHGYVVCMDGDSRLTRDSLRNAMRHFADPRVGAVAGNVKVVNRNNVWTRLQALEYIEGLNMARRAQGFLRVVNIIPGPIGVFRRDVLLRVGGYDTDTFAEDADMTLKLLTDGWHIVYEERAIAWTEAPESFLELVKQRYRWTRGILQALRKRAPWSWGARPVAPTVRVSIAMMLFEAVIWPAGSILGNLAFCVAALSTGAAAGVFYWWVLLTMLDVAAALYAVGMEGEDLRLIPYAVAYRLFFITMVDVTKLFATAEEAARVQMTWGKLERAGRI
ncbi:MAG TPA: glycosyltransferase family 2 protein [Gemmatimonadaceae bacterium]|nr:glycosyltransferase family 2 protein [Gemmatimonadaceae bacterium]